MFLGYYDGETNEQLFFPCKSIQVDLEAGVANVEDRDGDEVELSSSNVGKFYIINEGGDYNDKA